MMLLTMDLEIQQNLAHLGANDMLKELKALYSKQAEQELLQTMRDFHTCRQEEGQSVSSYVLKMKSYIDQLERLGHPVTLQLGVNLILVGLFKEYDSFVQNYNMHHIGKTVNELHAMLKLHEETLPKKVAAKGVQGKGKCKKAYANAEPSYAPKPKIPPPPKKDNPAKDTICHHCGEGLWGSKKLNPGALSLYVGNGQREAVVAIGNYHLYLPSGLVIVLNNFHYAPSITRWIISVSRLYEDGFINRSELNNTISVSKNDVVYFTAIPRDGLYEIEMSCSNTNDSSMYAVSNKRAKLNLDFSLLWHCRLGHISKKRIEKLQHDELLNSSDINRYGYVYLLKHKHEVFETFKVFQKEVENQLGKTIKSLRSDRGGEYMSQEFLDHLKEHVIIAHRTPPYTPQHNGVSEMRNRTLLDMVHSMMSQTTLPKSFWDYALESAARILNMVPTKKVDKTPYEIWHGQAPKLSYLKVWGREALNKVFVARNVEFFESNIIDQEASGSPEDLKIIQEEDTNTSLDTSLNHEEDDQEIDEHQSDINPIRRSTRTRRPRDRLCLYIYAEEHELGDLDEPANYKAALKDPESEKWLAAINVEMQSMKDNDVWELVELPSNTKTVGHKWLFKKKPTWMNPSELHWTTVKNILKYLWNTKDMFLVYQCDMKRELSVSCYTDAAYLTDADDLRSQTRYIRKFIYGLNVVPTIEEPITMYCDNTRAIAIANDHGVTKGARHFRAKVHYLRETINLGDMRIEQIDTDDNLVDPFTKALAFPKHSELTRKIGLIPASSLM
ncbi:retrotransposon protein, putative, ty1-copia subclass [Tanacetum coccineum]|uniref:Retrotransposon protein, putative, ty1-copia subclass n=1 Tax=Tanacetum coccineum TaxID=301880 RepID=A0ABQ5BR67_9ASTR